MEFFENYGRKIVRIVKDIEKLIDQYDIWLKNDVVLNNKVKGKVKENGGITIISSI